MPTAETVTGNVIFQRCDSLTHVAANTPLIRWETCHPKDINTDFSTALKVRDSGRIRYLFTT